MVRVLLSLYREPVRFLLFGNFTRANLLSTASQGRNVVISFVYRI